MGSAGHPHAHLQRALERGLKMPALAAAAQLSGTVPTEEALLLCLLLLDDPRFSKAAAKWHARFVIERRLALAESQMLLGLLHGLTGEGRHGTAVALAAVVARYGMKMAAAKLEQLAVGRWPYQAPAAA